MRFYRKLIAPNINKTLFPPHKPLSVQHTYAQNHTKKHAQSLEACYAFLLATIIPFPQSVSNMFSISAFNKQVLERHLSLFNQSCHSATVWLKTTK